MTLTRTLAALLGAILLAGCSGLNALPDTPAATSLADRFTRLLDGRCPIPADAKLETAEQREIRLLRAEWLLAILTRYGTARIEDFSGDKQADAAMLLTRVEHALGVIRQARVDVPRDPNQFELYRADLILALLHTAHSAIEPVLKVQKGFVLKPDPEDGLKLLGNYFEDKLYAQAYGLTCTHFMQAATQADKRPLVRQRVEEHLREQCDKLAKQSGLARQCSLPAPG
ncbi:MAG: hypothetical protein AB1831_12530 [Pseudomonadota bacterium]